MIAVLLLITMICPIYGGSLPEAKAEDLMEDYIILYDSAELSLQMETELMEANVYRNESVSTEYAESLGMALLELSEMEASALEKADGIVIVEKDMAYVCFSRDFAGQSRLGSGTLSCFGAELYGV